MPLIFVDSKYRASGTSTDFTWELPESVLLRTARLKVLQLRVPVTYYTVDARNKNMYVQDNAQLRVLKIPNGNYDGLSLAFNLKALLGEGFTCAFDSSRNSLEIHRPSGNFRIVPDKALTNAWQFPDGCSRLVPKSINANLRHPESTTSTQTTFFCPTIDLQTQPDLYLRCSVLADPKIYAPRGARDVLFKTAMVAPYGFVKYEQSPNEIWHEVGDLSLRTIPFSLTDAEGVPVDLHGAGFSFTLVVEERPV